MINIEQYETSIDESLVIQNHEFTEIHHLVIDSRNIMYPEKALFFALKGNLRDGHDFIQAAYNQGVRNFVLSDEKAIRNLDNVNYILSINTIFVIQKIAKQHREKFDKLEVIGITGSNGKTVVKEWLSILLSQSKNVVKTPKSFNSQIGVPLSVWQINECHEVGIFEAGISTYNEMEVLESIIKPSIGILTNIGDAHEKGFLSIEDKLVEKLKLFAHSQYLIFNGDNKFIKSAIEKNSMTCKLISWGFESHNAVQVLKKESASDKHHLEVIFNNQILKFEVVLANEFFFENLMLCISLALLQGMHPYDIEAGIACLDNVDMRLQLTEGLDGSLLINDAYTNDREALNIAIPFLLKHAGKRKKILVLSEFDNASESSCIDTIKSLASFEINEVLLIGTHWPRALPSGFTSFANTEELLTYLHNYPLIDKIVLIKGARKFGFESVYKKLVKQSHSVNLEIDLAAIENNLSVFASLLKHDTQIVPIIKASAYGTGSEEIAKILQHKGVYALGVAFADEGVQLRKCGIVIPIIVLNADSQSFNTIYNYNLQMEIYSISQLNSLIQWNNGAFVNKARIHLKFDTGMSRLGFRDEDIEELIALLKTNIFYIESIFSHLSSSEDSNDDAFTHQQAIRFNTIYERISDALNCRPKRHLLNSSGIVRFPEYHFELVRLGLGLYGIDSTEVLKNRLEKVHTLSAKIIQIKKLQIGDFVGYNRKHKVTSPMNIAVLNIGYADGLIRKAGNSNYSVLLNGIAVPIIGNICMDLTIIDSTNVPLANEGDEVTIFGKQNPIEDLAKVCDTIPYEILCRIAPRIKRNYMQ